MKTKTLLTMAVLTLGLASIGQAADKYEIYRQGVASSHGTSAASMIHVGTHTNKYDRAKHEKAVGFKATVLPSSPSRVLSNSKYAKGNS